MSTSAPHPRYADGAVSPQRHPDILNKLEILAREYPVSLDHRKAFQKLGSEYVYARQLMGEEVYRKTWIVLLRFSRSIEDRFGISAEVLIVYTPHHDLQIRTPALCDDILTYLPEDRKNVTKWIRYLWAPDVRLDTKLEDFSSTAMIYLPLSKLDSPGADENLIKDIAKRIHSKDLYAQHGSVTGDQFFGRKMLLNSIESNIRMQQIPALFGMRKTGKTAILKELERQNKKRSREGATRFVYVYQDLEDVPEIEFGNPVTSLLPDFAEKIRSRLHENGFRTQELAELNDSCDLLDFKRALQKILSHPSSRDLHLVLILDEIEHLCPPGADTAGATSTSTLIPQFFGVLRKLVQETRPTENVQSTGALSLVLAGLASASVESRELYGRENPLFNFAKPYYVSPFDKGETDDLLRVLGRRQGVEWDNRAVDMVQAETGGHVVLVRELASLTVNRSSGENLDIVRILESDVIDCLPKYRRVVAAQIEQILQHIKKYYNTEWSLIELLMDNADQPFFEYVECYPAEVNRLENLGILELSSGEWHATQLLKLGWNTGPAKLLEAKTKNDESREIVALVSLGESINLEFKSSFSAVIGSSGNVRDVVDSFIKVIISFFNSNGGTILGGVDDDGIILGIGPDLAAHGQSLDRLTLAIQSKLNSAIGSSLGSRVSISFPQVNGVFIIRCVVPAASDPVWPMTSIAGKNDVLFVRQSANTQALNARETADYIKYRFSRS
ncbi:putative DNA binding domain-containing protein [Rhodococcus erythropolis]|uniref:RNA-binding domain-containing protein n=1 Tax=Rhodococcus erythropolis TaxID=1833 RepID=UPI001BADBA3E|nr:RNA-binding domain-containing protein [Rhodococcus erythropolis]MBS2989974.1 putative DNA binding domain-containing protein [Rhodococcus erythropolis]